MATLTVNGVRHEVHAPDDTPLLYVLRDDLQLSGPQFGCGSYTAIIEAVKHAAALMAKGGK